MHLANTHSHQPSPGTRLPGSLTLPQPRVLPDCQAGVLLCAWGRLLPLLLGAQYRAEIGACTEPREMEKQRNLGEQKNQHVSVIALM